MTNPIYPCLWFDGQAEAAARFYCSVFEDSTITTSNPMVVNFELSGKKFMGLNGGPKFKINPSISFFALCDTQAELNEKWNKLSENGMIMMPLDSYPWSKRYGFCQDKFGVSWQLMLGKLGSLDEKIVACMMFTQSYAGRAEEAINFYTDLINNSRVDSISRYEKGEHDKEGSIKHAEFVLNNQFFTAMDSSAPHQFKFNEAISLVLNCETQEEIDYYWTKLTEDGEESQCGWLKDKFGVSWQIVPSVLGKLMADSKRAPRVIQAFLKMKKFDIKALDQA